MKLKLVILLSIMIFLVGCFNQLNSSITGHAVKTSSAKESQNLIYCNDSDGGINPSKAGWVYSSEAVVSDECNMNILVEYYCEGNVIKNKNFNCNSLGKTCDSLKRSCV